MKRMNRAQSSSLFLMELILAILFFSIASAVCVQFFIKSHMLSNDSKALNHAVNECSSMAEIINTADDIQDCLILLKSAYPDWAFSDDENTLDAELLFYYDDNFSLCDKSDSCYTLAVDLTQTDQMLITQMNFEKASGDSIYQLETKCHIARRITDETR